MKCINEEENTSSESIRHPLVSSFSPPFCSFGKECICSRNLQPEFLTIDCIVCRKQSHSVCYGYGFGNDDLSLKFQCHKCVEMIDSIGLTFIIP